MHSDPLVLGLDDIAAGVYSEMADYGPASKGFHDLWYGYDKRGSGVNWGYNSDYYPGFGSGDYGDSPRGSSTSGSPSGRVGQNPDGWGSPIGEPSDWSGGSSSSSSTSGSPGQFYGYIGGHPGIDGNYNGNGDSGGSSNGGSSSSGSSSSSSGGYDNSGQSGPGDQDDRFVEFRVWWDVDSDGVANDGELRTKPDCCSDSRFAMPRDHHCLQRQSLGFSKPFRL